MPPAGYRNDFKFSGGIPRPFDTMISGLFQVFAGNQILGNYSVGAGDLGRPPDRPINAPAFEVPLIPIA